MIIRFGALAQIEGSYFIRDIHIQCQIADALEDIEGLTLLERFTFS